MVSFFPFSGGLVGLRGPPPGGGGGGDGEGRMFRRVRVSRSFGFPRACAFFGSLRTFLSHLDGSAARPLALFLSTFPLPLPFSPSFSLHLTVPPPPTPQVPAPSPSTARAPPSSPTTRSPSSRTGRWNGVPCRGGCRVRTYRCGAMCEARWRTRAPVRRGG